MRSSCGLRFRFNWVLFFVFLTALVCATFVVLQHTAILEKIDDLLVDFSFRVDFFHVGKIGEWIEQTDASHLLVKLFQYLIIAIVAVLEFIVCVVIGFILYVIASIIIGVLYLAIMYLLPLVACVFGVIWTKALFEDYESGIVSKVTSILFNIIGIGCSAIYYFFVILMLIV